MRVVYVTHYVGFAQPVAEACAIAAERGLPLFEDCALALFSRTPTGKPLGSFGDASCFCLYKTLPVPHGGLLVAPRVPVADVGAPPLFSTLHHVAGLALAHLELHSSGIGRAVRQAARAASHATVDKAVATVKTGTMHLEPHELGLGASKVVEHLLPRFDAEMVVVRRRRNFARLAAALDGVRRGRCTTRCRPAPARCSCRCASSAATSAPSCRRCTPAASTPSTSGRRASATTSSPRSPRCAARSSSSPAINPSTTTRSTWWHMP